MEEAPLLAPNPSARRRQPHGQGDRRPHGPETGGTGGTAGGTRRRQQPVIADEVFVWTGAAIAVAVLLVLLAMELKWIGVENEVGRVMCNIDRKVGLNAAGFADQFHGLRPVVLYNAPNAKFREHFTLAKVKAIFGDYWVHPHTPYDFGTALLHGDVDWRHHFREGRQVRFATFVERFMEDEKGGMDERRADVHVHAPYLLDGGDLFDQGARLKRLFTQHALFANASAQLEVGVGANGTGVPFLPQPHGWWEVVFGSVVVLLFSPSTPVPFNPFASPTDWLLSHDMYDFRMSRCTLGVGDVLYVPEGWYLATVNVGNAMMVGQARSDAKPTQGGYFDRLLRSLHHLDALRRAEAGHDAEAVDEAVAHFEESLAHFPDPLLWNYLGHLLLETGRASEALHAFNEAVALNPELMDAVVGQARARLALGTGTDLGLAREAVQRAVALLGAIHRPSDALVASIKEVEQLVGP